MVITNVQLNSGFRHFRYTTNRLQERLQDIYRMVQFVGYQ